MREGLLLPVYGLHLIVRWVRQTTGTLRPLPPPIITAERNLANLGRNLTVIGNAACFYGAVIVVAAVGSQRGAAGPAVALAAFLVAVPAAVAHRTRAKAAARAAVRIAEFHRLFNARDLAGIRAIATPLFTASVSESDLGLHCDAVERVAGKVRATGHRETTAHFVIPMRERALSVTLIQDTQFERCAGIEHFTFDSTEDRIGLQDWTVKLDGLFVRCASNVKLIQPSS